MFASSRHATTTVRVKMAAAVLSGPSAGSAAGVPGGTGGLSAVVSVPRLRLLLLDSVSGLLQPRAGSTVAPVHPPAPSAPHLPGLMCLLRLHGTVGGAPVSLWPSGRRSGWKVGAAFVRRGLGALQLQWGGVGKENWGQKVDPDISLDEIHPFFFISHEWKKFREEEGPLFYIARLLVDTCEWVRSQATSLTRYVIFSFFFLRQYLFRG